MKQFQRLRMTVAGSLFLSMVSFEATSPSLEILPSPRNRKPPRIRVPIQALVTCMHNLRNAHKVDMGNSGQ